MSRRPRMPLAIVMFLCFFLTGCQERATFTSAFGQGIIAGSVVLGEELGGGTPAGIEASIPGTGMEALLAPDGRFVFAGVPEKAEIRFRRADGIDVSYRLGPGDATGLVIEISKSGAKRGRKRAVIGRSLQFEGLVVAATEESIVLDAAGKGIVTVQIAESTQIRKGNRILSASELETGARIHVMARPEGDAVVAQLVLVQKTAGDGEDEESDDESGVELEGLILEISPSSITVDAAGRGPTTARIDSSTKIRRGNTSLTAEDLEPGDRVHVKAKKVGEELLAKLILLQNP